MSKKNDLRLQREGTVINSISKKQEKRLGNSLIVLYKALTDKYMNCKRLITPAIKKSEIKEIILGGGQNLLSPERRFDAICNYYLGDRYGQYYSPH